MRRCSILIAALLFALTFATTAIAANGAWTPWRGISSSTRGDAVVSVAGDGSLQVDNIGSSGQEGVSFDCTGMDGMCLALSGSSSSLTEAGKRVQFTCSWSLSSPPAGSSGLVTTGIYCDMQGGGGGGWALVAKMGSLSSSPLYHVTLRKSGAVVDQMDVDPSAIVVVVTDAAGNCANPALSCDVNRTAAGHAWNNVCRAAFSQTVSVKVNSSAGEECDDIEFSAPVDTDKDCSGVSCDLRAAAASGSPPMSLRCADGACRALSHWVQGTGQALLRDQSSGLPTGRRLPVSNLGSSGQDGVTIRGFTDLVRTSGAIAGIVVAAADPDGDGLADDVRFAPPSLTFDPATDWSSSAAITIVGQSFSSSGVAIRESPTLAMSLSRCVSGACPSTAPVLLVGCDHSSCGADQEVCVVYLHGVEVGRASLPPGSAVSVLAPPGGPPAFAIASAGKHTKTGHVTLMKSPEAGARFAGPDAVASSSSTSSSACDLSCPMEVTFCSSRLFVLDPDGPGHGGAPLTGDQLVIEGASSSGALSGSMQVTSQACTFRCANPSSSSLSSVSLADLSSPSSDAIFAYSGPVAITPSNTCASIPVVFTRTDATPVRAFSVTFHLSPELVACAGSTGASVVEGDYLSRVAGTQFFVTDNGGGSYTVDDAVMGPVCGSTGDGTLFGVQLSAAAGVSSALGSVVVDAVTVRDCSNHPVVADPGPAAYVPIQFSTPPPVTGVLAIQKGNNPQPSPITGIQLTWTLSSATPPPPGSALSVVAFSKDFGGYPLYDKSPASGGVPTLPPSPAAALSSGWLPSSVSFSGDVEYLSKRGYDYYCAFVVDQFGNASPPSNMTTGTLDYHLGDVSDGSTPGQGDDHVTLADVSLLGAHYGTSVAAGSSYAYLDVGPTLDYSTDTRPTVDGKINFEDLMPFAMNYTVVSSPNASARPAAMSSDAVRLTVPSLPAVGQTFDAVLEADGAGDVLGVSAKLAYDANVVEQVGVANGALLDAQGRAGAVLSSGPGDVDVALLGRAEGISGRGDLARVTFRVKSAGDPGLALASVSARDGNNRPIPIAVDASAGGPTHEGLSDAYPNPFARTTQLQLSLAHGGTASITVYDVAGRRVRTLLQGAQRAGTVTVAWDGRDDSGVRLAPGAYVVRLESAGRRETRTIRLVR